MRIYLDNCCFNRPFDDQKALRVFLETKAKLAIQEAIRLDKLELTWSFILNYEILQTKSDMRKNSILDWSTRAAQYISAQDKILTEAKKLQNETGLRDKDALHLAAAIAGDCEYFITTDDQIIAKAGKLHNIKVVDPIDFLKMESLYEN